MTDRALQIDAAIDAALDPWNWGNTDVDGELAEVIQLFGESARDEIDMPNADEVRKQVMRAALDHQLKSGVRAPKRGRAMWRVKRRSFALAGVAMTIMLGGSTVAMAHTDSGIGEQLRSAARTLHIPPSVVPTRPEPIPLLQDKDAKPFGQSQAEFKVVNDPTPDGVPTPPNGDGETGDRPEPGDDPKADGQRFEGDRPPPDGQGDMPRDAEGDYQPPGDGEYRPPADQDGAYKPPPDGDGQLPPRDGSGSMPPPDGDGGYKPPPDGDGGYKPPPDGGGNLPPRDGGGSMPPGGNPPPCCQQPPPQG